MLFCTSKFLIIRSHFGSGRLQARQQTCTALTEEAEWALLAWPGRVVAMAALLQGQQVDTPLEHVALLATALPVELAPGRIALLAVLAAEVQGTALCRMLALGTENTFKRQSN